VEVSSRRPDPARVKTIKEIGEALDAIPALTPKTDRVGALGERLLRRAAGRSFPRHAAASG